MQGINPAAKVARGDFRDNSLPAGDQTDGRIVGAGNELNGGPDYPRKNRVEVIFMLQIPGQLTEPGSQFGAYIPTVF